jgi:AAA domain
VRVSAVKRGATSTIEVVRDDADVFPSTLLKGIEVSLLRARDTDDALLSADGQVFGVVGADRGNRLRLADVFERNLPRLCWLVASRPKQGPAMQLTLQIHEFPTDWHSRDEIRIGIDERIVEDIRRSYLTRQASLDDILGWLGSQLLIPSSADGRPPRALLSATPGETSLSKRPFRLYGEDIVIDVRAVESGAISIERLLRTRYVRRDDERRPVILLEAPVAFCELSVAATARNDLQTQLDQLVRSAGDYMSLWHKYNRLERESVLRRARDFGWVRFTSHGPGANGRWRFQLSEASDLEERIQRLGQWDGIELEATPSLPPHLRTAPSGSTPENHVEPDSRLPRLVGALAAYDPVGRTLDLFPDDMEEVELPQAGYLCISIRGDERRLERRERAVGRIQGGASPMPQLWPLLEGLPVRARRRHQVEPLSPRARRAFGGSPTERQKEALRVALNTPDVALIQGPPGTGKTGVIEALQIRLAELTEAPSLSGSILLTSYQHDAVENVVSRTQVLGLPPEKIGRRRGTLDLGDDVDRWQRQMAESVIAKLGDFPETIPVRVAHKVRARVQGLITLPTTAETTAAALREIAADTAQLLPGELRERLRERARVLAAGPDNVLNDGEADVAVTAVRAIRVDPVGFEDDGARNALKALRRLESLGLLAPDERRLLECAGDWDSAEVPPFLDDLAALRDRMLDILLPDDRPKTAALRDSVTEELLTEVVNAFGDYLASHRDGVSGVLMQYLDDLQNDPAEVRRTLREYTTVLAATTQQADSPAMMLAKGVSDGQPTFETVIVDEAARANPLDLFIPMSMAKDRIILVGDHRQLPHILEPDVERDLNESTEEATRAAFRESLFERLFQAMRERERQDGIRRTITLDTQYRMHPFLGDFVSRTFYEVHGESPLRPGREADEFQHELPGYENAVAAWWDVPRSAGPERGGISKYRPAEAKVLAHELRRLMEAGPLLTFGVISFYAAQVNEIWRALTREGIADETEDGSFRVAAQWRETHDTKGRLVERLRVGTVDAFQGKEFDVVFLSMTRCNDYPSGDERARRRKFGHLMLANRLCVAMSRQRRLLVLVGDPAMLRDEAASQAVHGLVAFRELCEGQDGVILPD